MGYDKSTPRSNRIGGRVGGKPEELAERGRTFWCNSCEGGARQLRADEVVGVSIQSFFHKGHLGHTVTVGTENYHESEG